MKPSPAKPIPAKPSPKQAPSAPVELELDVESLAYEGAAVARDGARVVFVEGGAPGDRVRAVITRERKAFAEARVSAVLVPGPARVVPPCPVADRCGGCDWQHVRYSEQLAAKRKIVVDALERMAKIPQPDVAPVLASPAEYEYRNRVRLHWSGGRLAYYERASRRPVQVSDCMIAEPRIRASLPAVTKLIASLETAIGEVEVASRIELPGVALTLHSPARFAAADNPRIARTLEAESVDGIRGVAMSGSRWARTWGDTRRAFDIPGTAISVETVEAGFGQVNSAANRHLVSTVLEVVAPRSDERVWDLYCGAGNLSLPLAGASGEVVGVELDPAAIAAARTAATQHGLSNLVLVNESVETFLDEINDRPDVVVANPPRGGLERSATRLAEIGAPRVIYVSCNPPTLARDLVELRAHGYITRRIRPLDLFPQTCRVETVCELALT